MAYNPYLPGLEPINTMNNPVWNPDTQQFEYGFGNSAKATQPGLPGWDLYDKPGLPSGYPGTEGSLNKRYVSVPEGMRETISDATIVDEYNAPNYLGSRSPITYPKQSPEGDPSRWYGLGDTSGVTKNVGAYNAPQRVFDPAFGELEQWDRWDTDYPGSFRKSGYADVYNEIPNIQRYEDPSRFALTNQGIAGLDVQETLTEQPPLDTSRFQDMYWGPSSEGNEEEEEVESEGITKGDRWRNFLSKITRQPYRPAMGGVTMGSGQTYSPAQLNKMNALGGWYSEPSRAARRTQNRINNMLARREAGKSYSQKNLEAFTGRDEGRGSYTATPTRSIRSEGPGVTASSGMHGGRHYARGGIIGIF